MDKCTVLFLSTSLEGGIGRNTLNLAKALTSLGNTVHVAAENQLGSMTKETTRVCQFHILPTTHPVTGVIFLAKTLVKLKPNLIVCENIRLTNLAIRSRRLIRSKPKIALNIHNTLSKKLEQMGPKKAKKRLKKLSNISSYVDAIISVSKGVKRDFEETSKIKHPNHQVIYNPLDLSEIKQNLQPPSEKSKHSQKTQLVCVGRLEKQKNFALPILALKQLPRGKYHLSIIGDGNEKQTLETLTSELELENEVDFLGFQNKPYQTISQSDVFILSSDFEGFGNVLIEAFACGTPVIATDCPHGPREILSDGKYGILIEPNNPEKLAFTIENFEKLKRQPPSEQQLFENYDSKKIASRYLEITM